MSSESTNLNLQQLQDFLFDPAIANPSTQPSKGFDFNGLWQNLHVPSTIQDTPELSCTSSSSLNNKQTTTFDATCLSDLIGDITPAAAAVVVANTEESPLMDTPFLDDSCMNTPFTPALFTPNPSHMRNLSPHCSPQVAMASSDDFQQEVDARGDVQIAKYLKNDVSWQASPTLATTSESSTVSTTDLFGQMPSCDLQDSMTATPDLLNTLGNLHHDPSQLLMDVSSTPTVNTDQLNTASSDINLLQRTLTETADFLFPPLTAEEENNNQQQNATGLFDDASQSLYQQQDFSAFDASALLDNCFDDLFLENNDLFNSSNAQQHQAQDETALSKRKFVHVDNSPALAASKVTNENPFKRIKLDKTTFKQQLTATKTSKVNHNERRFKCHLCDAMFSRRYNLGTHIKTHDKNRSKAFLCQLCDRTFDRKHDLSRHISTVHNGERAFACTDCTSTFSRKDALARHRVQKHNIEP